MIHLTDLDNNVVNCFAQGLVTTSKSMSPFFFNPHFIPRQFLPLMSLTQCPDALVDHCPSQQCPEAGNELPASNTRCPLAGIHQPRNLLSVFMASLQPGIMPLPSWKSSPPDQILVGIVLP